MAQGDAPRSRIALHPATKQMCKTASAATSEGTGSGCANRSISQAKQISTQQILNH
jgi:hypothetical protein